MIMSKNNKDDANAILTQTSSYEQRRLENIKRNNARLRSLGLISSLEEKRSNAAAGGIETDIMIDRQEQQRYETSEVGKKKRKRKAARTHGNNDDTKETGSRKSLRLQGIGIDLTPVPVVNNDRSSLEAEREERVRECREGRLRAANAIADCGADAAGKDNPTATYEHCLMRVKSMSVKRLATRVKVIERAAGKHCIIKMAIFKSCLQDEGMWSLAELANEALERLKGLKAIPQPE